MAQNKVKAHFNVEAPGPDGSETLRSIICGGPVPLNGNGHRWCPTDKRRDVSLIARMRKKLVFAARLTQ
jgi:hypothetical protein